MREGWWLMSVPHDGWERRLLPLFIAMLAIGIWVLPWLAERIVLGNDRWDDECLHSGLIATAVVVGVDAWASRGRVRGLRVDAEDTGALLPKHLADLLPGTTMLTMISGLLVFLAWLQYVAIGIGQPLIGAQHILVNLANIVGLKPSD